MKTTTYDGYYKFVFRVKNRLNIDRILFNLRAFYIEDVREENIFLVVTSVNYFKVESNCFKLWQFVVKITKRNL